MKLAIGWIGTFGITLALCASTKNSLAFTGAFPGINCAGNECPIMDQPGVARSAYHPFIYVNDTLSGYLDNSTASICLQSENALSVSCGTAVSSSYPYQTGVTILAPTSVPANWNNGYWGFAFIRVFSANAILGYGW